METQNKSKPWIVVAAFLAPMISGAIIYYGLKSKDPEMAKFGNRASWVAFAVYIGVSILFAAPLTRDPATMQSIQQIFAVLGAVGIVLSIVLLVRLRAPSQD
jgi:hypothetical protein